MRSLVLLALLVLESCSSMGFDRSEVFGAWIPNRRFGSHSVFDTGDGVQVGGRLVAPDLIEKNTDVSFEVAVDVTDHNDTRDGSTMTAVTLENSVEGSLRVGSDSFALVSRLGVGVDVSAFDSNLPLDCEVTWGPLFRAGLGVQVGGVVIAELRAAWMPSTASKDTTGLSTMITLGGGFRF